MPPERASEGDRFHPLRGFLWPFSDFHELSHNALEHDAIQSAMWQFLILKRFRFFSRRAFSENRRVFTLLLHPHENETRRGGLCVKSAALFFSCHSRGALFVRRLRDVIVPAIALQWRKRGGDSQYWRSGGARAAYDDGAGGSAGGNPEGGRTIHDIADRPGASVHALRKAARRLIMMELVEGVEGRIGSRGCMFAKRVCPPGAWCAFPGVTINLETMVRDYFARTTIADLCGAAHRLA